MNLSKFGLLFVVFVDVMGQGLIIPIINSLVMDPSQGLLSSPTPAASRHFDYGLVIGIFYLSWFLGSVYISKLSDSIGRKNGILICLAGALAGYVLTVLAIAVSSLWLMILGRAITGFTAGNQPIAQAAMVDLSRDDADKTRNMGHVVSALSLGLIAGPIVAGVLSDKSFLGDFASLSLPFYFAMVTVVIAAFLIAFFFEDKLQDRAPLQVGPAEVFRLLWRIFEQPTVMRIAAVYFFFMLVWNTAYVFIDNYLSSRFDVGTLGTSMAMLVIGIALVTSSAVLVSIVNRHLSKQGVVTIAAAVMGLSALIIVISPWVSPVYLATLPLAAAFAVGYPTLLSLFSASVSDSEQGWVMGVTTALWTLSAGLTSLLGGDLMERGLVYPFVVAIVSALICLALIATLWRAPGVRRIVLS